MTCLWCEPPAHIANSDNHAPGLPEVFCWTKMQAEAGQPLELILRRKEAERAAGGGLFFWGIGTSVAGRLLQMLEHVPKPKVLFSVMKSRPKLEDASPKAVFLWTSYVDLFGGKDALPEHAVVLSRAYTKSGLKTHHYALVCRSDVRLDLRPKGSIKLGHFRNLGSDTPRIGSSQVTAIIEHLPTPTDGPIYAVDLVADLADPYLVRLDDPVLLPPPERTFVDSMIDEHADGAGWMELARHLKQRAGVGALAPAHGGSII
ncbi:MAG: hypothetical protein WD773_09955 [Gemmatimonadales bacterium]